MPRWPAEYCVDGAMNGRTIWCAPRTGHAQRGSDALADVAAEPTANTSPRKTARRNIHSSWAKLSGPDDEVADQ
jgi:hypothetical protein